MKIPSSRKSGGVALIIALAFIVIVSVLVVGLSETLRTERSAVRTHLERQRATTMAQHGTDLVMSRLQQYTVDPPKAAGESDEKLDARTRHWVSQPGRLLVANPDKSSKPKLIDAEVPLSSGLPSPELLEQNGNNVDFYPPNLNEPLLLEPETHLITEEVAGGDDPSGTGGGTSAATVKMPVRWVYVRKDGTMVRTADDSNWDDLPPATDTVNPLVGRFAFWADDESTKVNYNLAWTRDAKLNTQPPGHPTRIDLRALKDFSDASANELHKFVTTDDYRNIGRFFNTPFDARFGASPELLKALNTNRFNLTHYNHEPDTTYYGRSRMVLTTQFSNAVLRDKDGSIIKDKVTLKPVTRPFLDIVKRPNETSTTYVDPGYLDNLDGKKLALVINNLVNNYLKKSDWPMADGHSIQEKYYKDYTGLARDQRLAQIALNIIDYVRSAESKKLVVEPIRGKYNASGNFDGDFVDGINIRGQEDTFKGLVRAPSMTEMGLWQSDTAETQGPNKNRFRTIGFVEIYLPADYGIDSINLTDWQLYFREFGNSIYKLANGSASTTQEYGVVARNSSGTPSSPVFVWEAQADASKNTIKPGEYRTLAMEMWRDSKFNGSTQIPLRAAISLKGLSIAGKSPYRIDLAPIGDVGNAAQIMYTVVPMAAPMGIASFETADPRVNGVAADWILQSKSSFGMVNNRWVSSVGQNPTVAASKPEQDTDRLGKVSAASLRMPYPYGHAKNLTGRVRSSGELGVIHTGIEGSSKVAGGGTSWRTLRLQPSNASTVMPDWAFMDLFTPPVDVPVKAASLFAPHGTAAGGRVNMNANPEPFSQSSYKLVRSEPLAAVLYKSRKSSVDPNKLVSEDEARTLARNIYERQLAKKGKAYGSTNFPCYESPGEVAEIKGIADEGEESEELIREIANLITARGNTFAVYSIGQALQQTPGGHLNVTAEQRQHVLLERYTNDLGEVHLGTVYFRNLIP